ncbi:hypothetical protein GCM10027035_29940 [Emticicia sediminis]
MNKIKHYFTLFLLLPTITYAQVLLKDINTANSSSHPYSAFDLNGTALFISNSQLWKTDGTTANTSIILNPNQYPYNGPSFNNITTKLKLNNHMFFVTEGTNSSGSYVGRELWKTDGTSAGTTLVADIYSGTNSSNPELLATIGNYIYFSAFNNTAGRELWSTDGTTVNFLGDIYAGSDNSNYYYADSYAALGTKMIFKAYNSTSGTEIWVTDGTQAGTFLLKDIYPGSNSSNISNLTAVGSKVYFSASNPTYGSELWVTDGTSAGTQMVLDIYSSSCLSCGSNPSNLRELNGSLIFSAQSSTFGTELWKSDGTAAGTTLLKNIYPSSSSSSPQDLTKCDNKIFFTAENGTVGRELWVTDGTTAGTNLVKDINLSNSAGDISFPLNSNQRKFINVNGTLFFIANSGIEGNELWKSDGTTSGTNLVKDFLPGTLSGGYSNFTVVGSKLYFIVEDNGIKKLCISDGTTAGSISLETIAPGLDMTNGYPLVDIGNTLLFVAYHSQYGYELYKTDGTLAGTSFLKDIDTNPFYPSVFNLKTSNSNVTLFNFDNNKNGLELWRTDGSTNGTREMVNLNPYPILNIDSYNNYSGASSVNQIIAFNNEFYISINGSIWKTDGVNAPVIFKGINSFSPSHSSNKMAVSNGKLFFNNPEDSQLWATDGTEAGTYLVKAITGGSTFDPSQMIDINGTLFFSAYSSSTGYELWKSDGTTAGTILIKDITSGTSSTAYNNSNYTKVGNKLYFINTTSLPYKLMVSDGTDAGTLSLLSNNSFNNLTNLNDNLLLFTLNDNGILYGNELWTSNGTVAGTTIVKDINAGTSSSNPYNNIDNKNLFAIYNGKAYFSAYDGSTYKLFASDGTNAGTNAVSSFSPSNIYATPYGLFFGSYSVYGNELYKSDGTAAGTKMVADINSGTNSSHPNNFYYNKNLLYFIATNASNGTEIFVLKLCDDNLNQTASINGVKTYQVNNTIQATNTIESNARVDYTAGKAILLNPGFKTNTPAGVFLAKIDACLHNPEEAPLAQNRISSVSNKSSLLTQTYLNDIKTIPSINEFLSKSSNPNFLDLWYKTNTEKSEIEKTIRSIDKNTPDAELKVNQLKQQLNEYSQSIKFNKDKSGKITEYILTIRTVNQSESTIITMD